VSADWEEELSALRVLYLREARGRLDDLDRLLELLERDGGDARSLQDLRRAASRPAGQAVAAAAQPSGCGRPAQGNSRARAPSARPPEPT